MAFDLKEVFPSIQAFLSSGYVALAILVVLGIGAAKRAFGLALVGGVMFAVWFLCQEQIADAVQTLLALLPWHG